MTLIAAMKYFLPIQNLNYKYFELIHLYLLCYIIDKSPLVSKIKFNIIGKLEIIYHWLITQLCNTNNYVCKQNSEAEANKIKNKQYFFSMSVCMYLVNGWT